MRLVKQRHLQDIVDKRVMLADLQRQLDEEKAQLTKMEAQTIVALEQGAVVERGVLSAAVQERPGQRRPSWKDAFAQLAGPAEVERVINETPLGPATKSLAVMQGGKVTRAA